jgi:hypothetical protein
VKPGELYRHDAFYRSAETARLEPKYLVLLAILPSSDLVARLLTSRPHGRPEQPACFHGRPYSNFYLGTIGGPLSSKSWVDLRYHDDFDEFEFRRRLKSGRIVPITSLAAEPLRNLLDCAAAAEDTTGLQERAIRDALAQLR